MSLKWNFYCCSPGILNFLLLITISISVGVILPIPNTDGNQPCVKPVNETIFPKCRITFREEGSSLTFNSTCLEDNVFVINKTKSRFLQSKDSLYFMRIFEDGLPPYARITCTSLFPTDFDFKGVGALDFFRVWKGQRRTTQNTTYTLNAEILLTPESTGKYIFHSIANPEISTSFFIFSQRGAKPYLIGETRTIPAEKLNASTIIIPCIASDLNANVSLFKRADDMIWVKQSTTNIPYDRQKGFIMNPGVSGEYRCFSDSDDSESTDYVTVHVKTTAEEQQVVPTPKKLTLELINATAVCYSAENTTKIKFSNANSRNPTESRLLELCLRRKNLYCGTHSYHQRREGRKIDGRACPKNSSNCLWITDLHAEGIFYCETEDEGDTISQEYFTGLDGKIYTNISEAATNILIRAEWRPNGTALKTGTLYEFSCEAVSLLFLKDPFTLSLKYKNGTVDKLADLVWWLGSRSFYLTTEVEEIICSDNLWKTNELINSGTKIVVTEKQCESEQFKCKSGQCIRETWRCDGDKDCGDGSDEDTCSDHHCKTGHFKCANGLCIMADKKCNNKNECQDGSDESPETCANVTCGSEDFKCASGQCAPAHFLCDGDKDCFDQSDEAIEHCSKYYPQFTQTRTHTTFSPNSLNELICKVSQLPLRLKPTLAWWRRGENISDPERLWKDNTGLKLSLRFENVTEDDDGEYTCVAVNKLQRVVQVFTVSIKTPELDMSCRPDLIKSECLTRGCTHLPATNTCVSSDDAVTVTTTTIGSILILNTTTTTAPPTTVDIDKNADTATSTNDSQKPEEVETVVEVSSATSTSGNGLTIGISFVIISIIALVLTGIGWRYFTRRHIPVGSARMRDDQEVVLSGI